MRLARASSLLVLLVFGCAESPTGSTAIRGEPWATGRIAFAVQTPGEKGQLLMLDVATGRVARIATAEYVHFFGLSWAGGTIVFHALPITGEYSQVFGIEPDGSNMRNLFPSAHHSSWSSISKQGRVAYRYNALPTFTGTAIDGRPAIPDGEYTRPAWSPDGRYLTVATPHISGTTSMLREYDVDVLPRLSSRIVFAAPALAQYCSAPIYSPDGRHLALGLSFPNARGEPARADIWVADADGTGGHPVTTGAYDAHAAWSPDGTRLAFARSHAPGGPPGSRLYVVRPDGTDLQLLYDGEAHDPVWAP
jgi:WD40 repeat protein